MGSQTSNKIKELLWQKIIDGINDTFKAALMGTGFAFNPATHNTWADVSTYEVPAGSGYTAGGNALTGNTVTKDDTANQGILSFNNTSWTMSGADLETVGAIIYDDTVATPVSQPILGFIDYNGSITTFNGGTHTLGNIEIPLGDCN